MYRCEICGEVAPPNTPATRIVLVVRPYTYPFRVNAHRDPKTHRRQGKPTILTSQEAATLLAARNGKHDPCDDPGGCGYQIVKEAVACPCCADVYRDRPPVTLRE